MGRPAKDNMQARPGECGCFEGGRSLYAVFTDKMVTTRGSTQVFVQVLATLPLNVSWCLFPHLSRTLGILSL